MCSLRTFMSKFEVKQKLRFPEASLKEKNLSGGEWPLSIGLLKGNSKTCVW